MHKLFGRRNLLKMAGLTGAVGLTGGMSMGQHPDEVKRIFNPVQVHPQRVIRTLVGLRPYRASGFVLRTEKLGDKTLIHNYGHGGSGVTLSWGVATLAADMVSKDVSKHVAILGSGVIGLSTARVLQQRGYEVTIYTKAIPPHTTSNIAGALWFPTTLFEKDRVDSAFMSQFNQACQISYRRFQDLIGDEYGVKWINHFNIESSISYPGGTNLYPGVIDHFNPSSYFGSNQVQEFNAMLIEPSIYLDKLIRDFYMGGGSMVIKTIQAKSEITELNQPQIINCTGLGAASLFDDKELIPVSGQLCVLLPQEDIDYSYVAPAKQGSLYMFPRKDGIILGGTMDKGNWSTDPDPLVSKRILEGHANIAGKVVKS